MSITMREKIARALLAVDYPDDAGGEMEDYWWDKLSDEYLAYADATLDALMEPTEGIMEEAFGHDPTLWVRMIQAAKDGK